MLAMGRLRKPTGGHLGAETDQGICPMPGNYTFSVGILYNIIKIISYSEICKYLKCLGGSQKITGTSQGPL
jgi:hypothetical protein